MRCSILLNYSAAGNWHYDARMNQNCARERGSPAATPTTSPSRKGMRQPQASSAAVDMLAEKPTAGRSPAYVDMRDRAATSLNRRKF
jgi:hypothetical protein